MGAVWKRPTRSLGELPNLNITESEVFSRPTHTKMGRIATTLRSEVRCNYIHDTVNTTITCNVNHSRGYSFASGLSIFFNVMWSGTHACEHLTVHIHWTCNNCS